MKLLEVCRSCGRCVYSMSLLNSAPVSGFNGAIDQRIHTQYCVI